MEESSPQRRCFYPAPASLVCASLLVTAILFLAERWRWFPFNAQKGYTVLIAVAAVGVVLLAMLLWFLVALVFRRQFQFGIRMLLLLTLTAALPCSWLATEMRAATSQKAAVEKLRELGASVYYSWTIDADGDWMLDANGTPLERPLGPEPLWLRGTMGEDFFADVYHVRLFCERDRSSAVLSNLRSLPQLRRLELGGSRESPPPIESLAGLTELRILDLSGTEISDSAIEEMPHSQHLKRVDLSDTNFGDEGAKRLAKLRELHELSLDSTQVTDVGIARLAALTQIETLGVSRTAVTGSGFANPKPAYRLRSLVMVETTVTEQGLRAIASLDSLQSLNLSYSHITVSGLGCLEQLPQLECLGLAAVGITDRDLDTLFELRSPASLDLSVNELTDAGVRRLHRLPKLRSLGLYRTKVSEEGERELRRVMPNCRITR
jgi:hypothetical protein